MTTEKPLVQFVAYPLALAACVAISLWLLLGVLRLEWLAGGRQESTMTMHLPIMSTDSGLRVKQMQKALVSKGYFIGPAEADGDFNEDTMTALGTFQDNHALPVEPQCDQQCWSVLSGSDPKSARRQ